MTPPSSEKRRHHRIARKEGMAYSIFSVQHWAEVSTLSFNLSRRGIGFICQQALSPRTIVCIRSTPAGELSGPEDLETKIPMRVLAEVKWCHERVAQEGRIYEVGASYLQN